MHGVGGTGVDVLGATVLVLVTTAVSVEVGAAVSVAVGGAVAVNVEVGGTVGLGVMSQEGRVPVIMRPGDREAVLHENWVNDVLFFCTPTVPVEPFSPVTP